MENLPIPYIHTYRHPISPETSLIFLTSTSATTIRTAAITKSPTADISWVGISFTPEGAILSAGNVIPHAASVSLP